MRNRRSWLYLTAVATILAAVPTGLAQCPGPCEGDLNGDGCVSLSDLATLLARYGVCCDQAWEPDEHTVALWYLNGNGLDFSGNGNDLTIKTDRVGWVDDAPHCRGVLMGADPGDAGGCPDNGALSAPGAGCTYPGSGDWTVEAWVYFPSNNAGYNVVQHYSEHWAGHDPYQLNIQNGTAIFEINNTANVSADVSSQCGDWFHLAAVYRYQQDIALWVNGERLAFEPTADIPETLTDYNVYLGGNYCGTSPNLKIDETRIADRAGSPGWQLRVANSHSDRIVCFDGVTAGVRDIIIDPELLVYPTGMVVGPDGNLYISAAGPDAVLRYDCQAGELDTYACCSGFEDPGGLTFGPDGALYVVAHSPQAVVRFDGPTDEDCAGECELFTSGGSLISPFDLAFGPDGNLYVTSSEQDNVQIFDGTTGVFIETLDCAGLDHPNGVQFGPDGNLYICSGFTNEVWCYNLTTEQCEVVVEPNDPNDPAPDLDFPGYLEFGPDGNLYVGNIYGDNVYRYSLQQDGTLTFLEIFASGGGMMHPKGLAFVREQ